MDIDQYNSSATTLQTKLLLIGWRHTSYRIIRNITLQSKWQSGRWTETSCNAYIRMASAVGESFTYARNL